MLSLIFSISIRAYKISDISPSDEIENYAEERPQSQSKDMLHFFAMLIRTSTVGKLRLFWYADREG